MKVAVSSTGPGLDSRVDPSRSLSKEEEIVMLKNQVNVMKQQLDEILRRMDKLEKK